MEEKKQSCRWSRKMLSVLLALATVFTLSTAPAAAAESSIEAAQMITREAAEEEKENSAETEDSCAQEEENVNEPKEPTQLNEAPENQENEEKPSDEGVSEDKKAEDSESNAEVADRQKDDSGIQAESTTDANVLDSGTFGSNLKWTLDENYTLTISGNGSMPEWKYTNDIPWHDNWSARIQKIVLENGITSIGNGAFINCTGATSVEMPNSVTSISNYAFGECTALKSITLSSNVSQIGDYAFGWCSELTHAEIPASVSEIGNAPFAACTKIRSINVSANNKYYSSLDGVLFDKSQTKLIQYPCGKSGAYTVPGTVENIGVYAFGTAETVGEIVLPESLMTISDTAFVCCHSMKSITIPARVAYIGDEAFGHCYNLQSVYFKGNAPVFDANAFGGDGEKETALTATVYYPGKDATWTDAVRQNYGGKLTWKADNGASSVSNKISGVKTSIKKYYSIKAQSFSLGAECLSGSSLNYKSNQKAVKVNGSGKVTIEKKYLGSATITITAPATGQYKKATKKVSITVKPKGTEFTSMSSPNNSWFKAKWKKVGGVSGYQIKVSEVNKYYEPDGKSKTMTVKGAGKSTLTLDRLEKKRIYYVTIRTYVEKNGKKYFSDWCKEGSYIKLEW